MIMWAFPIETVMLAIDLFVSSTSHFNIDTLDHMNKLKNTAFVGNTGHFDNRIDLPGSEGRVLLLRTCSRHCEQRWSFFFFDVFQKGPGEADGHPRRGATDSWSPDVLHLPDEGLVQMETVVGSDARQRAPTREPSIGKQVTNC